MASSKKGISAHQLHRSLGITYKSAWFMSHRIREAMNPGASDTGPMGGEGKTVEADEMFISKSPKTKRQHNQEPRTKRRVLGLVERGGKVRSINLPLGPENWMRIKHKVVDNVHPATRLVTDSANHYRFTGLKHEAVNHSAKEYVRGDVHTNSIEGYFSLFKRGLVGTYQHMSDQHLSRYLVEFDFRMNNRAKLGIDDTMRAAAILKGAEGKRLTYNQAD